MADNAFSLAKSIRYQDDIESIDFSANNSLFDDIRFNLSLTSLKATKDLTPDIYDALIEVSTRLKLNIKLVEIFISSSSDIQAGCLSVDTNGCIITLNSSLVNLLTIDELQFVIAHELGHFLLQHNRKNKDGSPESLISQRAMEISVDRIGLCGCKDLKTAISAIMKLLSGLDENLLRFDINSFLDQLNHDDHNASNKQQNLSTHPSLLLRAKSLVRFANSKPYQKLKNNMGGTNLSEIDNLIRKDLDFFMDSHYRDQEVASKELVKFWLLVYALTKDGDLSKESQKLIVSKFGEEKKSKLIKMLKHSSKKQGIQLINKKLISTIKKYKELSPAKAKKELNSIIIEIEKVSDSDLLKEIQRVI